jgi:hypothetical protein
MGPEACLAAQCPDPNTDLMVPGEGFEPPTFGLQNRCTATVLTRRACSTPVPWAPHILHISLSMCVSDCRTRNGRASHDTQEILSRSQNTQTPLHCHFASPAEARPLTSWHCGMRWRPSGRNPRLFEPFIFNLFFCALAFKLLPVALPFGAAEPNPVLRRSRPGFSALALFAILVEIDDHPV